MARLAERACLRDARSAVPGAPAFVGHGVAAGDGYASRSAVAGRRTSLCASCDRHGPRARRGSCAAGWDREHAAATRTRWSWASRGGEGRPAAARQEPSAAREGRTPDRAGSRWPDPPTGSPARPPPIRRQARPPEPAPIRRQARHAKRSPTAFRPRRVHCLLTEVARQPRRERSRRGKSGLHRAGCQVTPGRREPTESATENRPPNGPRGRVARVKRWGKSPPPAGPTPQGTANPTRSKAK